MYFFGRSNEFLAPSIFPFRTIEQKEAINLIYTEDTERSVLGLLFVGFFLSIHPFIPVVQVRLPLVLPCCCYCFSR